MGRRRVDLQTAAELLGISSDAVRKRAKRGNMPYETGTDGKLYVWVDEAKPGETEDYPTGDLVDRGGQDRTDAQAELVESLLEQLSYMREQLAEEREARRRADTIMAQLSQANAEQARTIWALEPSQEARDAPETPAEEVSGGEVTPSDTEEPRRPSWWRRFFGFE